MLKDKLSTLRNAISEVIDVQGQGTKTSIDRDKGDILLSAKGIVLHIYIAERLVGYKIYPKDIEDACLLSDTDLYDLTQHEWMLDSVEREIMYVLERYLSGDIIITESKRRTIFGTTRLIRSIQMPLPDGTMMNRTLPCINQALFDFSE